VSTSSSATFLIPCFNGAPYIEEAIRSCLSQTRPPEQIIVIDDASTDESSRILEDFDRRGEITLVVNPVNIGKAASLNNAIGLISTPYVAMMDADDLSEPDRLEKQICYLEAHPGTGLVAGWVKYINSSSRVFGEGKVVSPTTPEDLKRYLASDELFGLHYSSVTLRTAIFEDKDLRFHGEFFPAEDTDLWNRIAEKGWGVINLPDFFSLYRVHPASAWTSKFMSARLTYHYMRECMRARRAGRAEPTRAEFEARRAGMSTVRRFNQWRKDMAKGLYRAAGFARGDGQWFTAAVLLLRAVLHQPLYALRRLTGHLWT
jgi:glycosyltransferase involved in cell wall biosynthesis